MKCHSKINFTLKKGSHPKWYVTQNEVSLKIECHSKLNVTQNGISFKNGMSLKMEYHSK